MPESGMGRMTTCKINPLGVCLTAVAYPQWHTCPGDALVDWLGPVALRAAGRQTTPGRVWWVKAVCNICPLCSHGAASHDGEACSVEVGYDHINGSHECGCPLTAPDLEVPDA